MREPEVSGVGPALFRVVLAALLALPVLSGGWSILVTTGFLVEFLSEGRPPLLSRVTLPPGVRPLTSPQDGQGLVADLYLPFLPWRSRSLVLVHGLSPAGKDDPRLQAAARLLARAGFRVLVPTVPGLTQLRLRPDDTETVVRAIEAVSARGGVRVLGVSVGTGPALLAAADPRVAEKVNAVLSLGGYASTVELLRYFLTGTYRFGAIAGRANPDPRAVSAFLRANADLLDDSALRLVQNRDPDRVEPLVGALSPRLRELLGNLSPEREVARLRGKLLLVHGKNDPAIPFTESLRLARAASGRVPTRLVLLGVVGHVEPEAASHGWWAAGSELLALWALVYDFFSV